MELSFKNLIILKWVELRSMRTISINIEFRNLDTYLYGRTQNENCAEKYVTFHTGEDWKWSYKKWIGGDAGVFYCCRGT